MTSKSSTVPLLRRGCTHPACRVKWRGRPRSHLLQPVCLYQDRQRFLGFFRVFFRFLVFVRVLCARMNLHFAAPCCIRDTNGPFLNTDLVQPKSFTGIHQRLTLERLLPDHRVSLHRRVFCQAFARRYWCLTKPQELEGRALQQPWSKPSSIRSFCIKLFGRTYNNYIVSCFFHRLNNFTIFTVLRRMNTSSYRLFPLVKTIVWENRSCPK